MKRSEQPALKHQLKNSRKRKNKKQAVSYHPLRRGFVGNIAYWFGMACTHLSINLTAEGTENIPKQTPYIIVANHETYVDGMWIGSFLPRNHFRRMAAMAASDLEEKHGLFGKIIVRVGRAISIDRFGNPLRGLIAAVKNVKEGNILLIHPEGTRTADGQLGDFKDGAAYIAFKSQVPLLPVFIDGGFEVFNRHMKTPQPFDTKTGRKKRVILKFGEPINPADFSDKKELTAALTAWMKKRFKSKKIPRSTSSKQNTGNEVSPEI